MVNSITIHNIDAETEKYLMWEAKQRGITIDALILQLIQDRISKIDKKEELQTYHDLDSIAGTWNEEEIREFEEAITLFEQIDDNLWR